MEHIILAAVFLTSLIVCVLIIVAQIGWNSRQILDALQALEHPSFNDPPEFLTADYSHGVVTCGGCGKSIKTYDGFNPVQHVCDPFAK